MSTSMTYASSEGRTPYLPSLPRISLNMLSEAEASWSLAWLVLSTKGRCTKPSNPSSQCPLPTSLLEMVAPSALMLLVAVVSAFSSTSSMTSAALRTNDDRTSEAMATTESSSKDKDQGTCPTNS